MKEKEDKANRYERTESGPENAANRIHVEGARKTASAAKTSTTRSNCRARTCA